MAPFALLVACSSCSSSSSSPDGPDAPDAPDTTDSGSIVDSAIEDSGADTATEVETSTDGGLDAADSGTACNEIENVGEVVEEMRIAATKPVWTGGTLVDGTYVLTAFENYQGTGGATGPTGQKLRFTLVLTAGGTHGEVANEVVGKSSGRSSVGITVATATQLLWKYSCLATRADESWDFSASGDTLAIAPPGTSARLVFTKK